MPERRCLRDSIESGQKIKIQRSALIVNKAAEQQGTWRKQLQRRQI